MPACQQPRGPDGGALDDLGVGQRGLGGQQARALVACAGQHQGGDGLGGLHGHVILPRPPLRSPRTVMRGPGRRPPRPGVGDHPPGGAAATMAAMDRRIPTLWRLAPRGFTGRALRTVALVVPVLVAAIGAGPTGASGQRGPSGSATTAGGGYVALGDSFTSGPLVPAEQADPAGCHRSTRNYPHLVARALGLTLSDVSCSGAGTGQMTSSQTTCGGVNPPQLRALRPSTSVVTLGVGGDDIDFTGVAEHCLAVTPWGPTGAGWTCASHYDRRGADLIAAAVRATAPRVAAVLGDIHRSAPRAAVFVVGYPAILPAAGDGCWPTLPFTRTDVPYLRSAELDLNRMLSSVASAGGATYVDTYDPSARDDACAPASTRWIEPVLPTSPAYPLHPNATGEAGLAAVVTGALRRAGIS